MACSRGETFMLRVVEWLRKSKKERYEIQATFFVCLVVFIVMLHMMVSKIVVMMVIMIVIVYLVVMNAVFKAMQYLMAYFEKRKNGQRQAEGEE